MVEGAHFRVCQHHRERFGGRRATHSKEEAAKWIKRRAIQKAAICLYVRFRKPLMLENTNPSLVSIFSITSSTRPKPVARIDSESPFIN